MRFYRRQAERTTGTRFASRALSAQARKRPAGVLRDPGVRRSREPLQQRTDSSVSYRAPPRGGIPQRDASISHDAAPLCPLDRASAKDAAEFFFGQRSQPFQARLKERLRARRRVALPRHLLPRRDVPRMEGIELSGRHASIPRANVLADITAEDMSPHGRAEFLRNAASQLDCQIRNAPACIEHVWLDECARRTGVQTQPAVAA